MNLFFRRPRSMSMMAAGTKKRLTIKAGPIPAAKDMRLNASARASPAVLPGSSSLSQLGIEHEPQPDETQDPGIARQRCEGIDQVAPLVEVETGDSDGREAQQTGMVGGGGGSVSWKRRMSSNTPAARAATPMHALEAHVEPEEDRVGEEQQFVTGRTVLRVGLQREYAWNWPVK